MLNLNFSHKALDALEHFKHLALKRHYKRRTYKRTDNAIFRVALRLKIALIAIYKMSKNLVVRDQKILHNITH